MIETDVYMQQLYAQYQAMQNSQTRMLGNSGLLGALAPMAEKPSEQKTRTHTIRITEASNGLILSIGHVTHIVGPDAALAEELAAAWTQYKLGE